MTSSVDDATSQTLQLPQNRQNAEMLLQETYKMFKENINFYFLPTRDDH